MSNSLEFLRPMANVLRPVFAPLWFVFELFCKITDRVQQIFGVSVLAGMWALLVLNMIGRWTDWYTVNWMVEILKYMVAWSIFIMMGPITRANEHIKVTFLPEKLLGESRGATFIFAAESVIGLILCLYFTYHAYDLVVQTGDLRVESSAGWEYPMKYIRGGLLVGFSFSSVYYLERNIKWIKGLFTGSGGVSSSGGTEVLVGKKKTEETAATEAQMETGAGDTNNGNGASEREQE